MATLSAQYGISNTTLPTDSADLSRPQIEVVNGDPIKELMAKYKVATLTDIEIMDLKDMITMLKEVYTITANNNQLETVFNEVTKKLESCID